MKLNLKYIVTLVTLTSAVELCHIPPGNEGNPQSLDIGQPAVDDHLREHPNDYLGPCTEPPTHSPSLWPTTSSSENPTYSPTHSPSLNPTYGPTSSPSLGPTHGPTSSPSPNPTYNPTSSPSLGPTYNPTSSPSLGPTHGPTSSPSPNPTYGPTSSPSLSPTHGPTTNPTDSPTVCYKPVDVNIVLDKSGSIGFKGVIGIRNFAKGVVDRLTIGPGKFDSRASVTFFSGKARVQVLLGSKASRNKAAVMRAINKLPGSSGWTNMRQALRFVRFKNIPKTRKHVTSVVLLVTDGAPTRRNSGVNKEIPKVITEVNFLKSFYPDTRIVTVGVGRFRKQFLTEIASPGPGPNGKLAFAISFNKLPSIIRQVSDTVCRSDDLV